MCDERFKGEQCLCVSDYISMNGYGRSRGRGMREVGIGREWGEGKKIRLQLLGVSI